MKRTILLFCFLLFTLQTIFSQNPTPNAGFENWTLKTIPTQYEVPDDWDQLNEETNFIGILTCIKTTDAHSDSFAVKLVTKIVTILSSTDTANGIVTTGHLITVPPYGVNGGIPYNQRPDSIYGWFKYEPAPGDSCQIQFDLFDVNNSVIGTALFKTSQTISSYTRFSAPIVYFSSANPDTSRWIISASNGYNSLPNSTLYVDDIGIVSNVGIDDVSLDDFIILAPNPASEVLWVKNENRSIGKLQFLNVTGSVCNEFDISNEEEIIPLTEFPDGIYLARWWDQNNGITATAKVIIRH